MKKLNLIIIEDEEHSARKLEGYLLAINPLINVQARLKSVKNAVNWLRHHPEPDVIFLDIQLSDGLSFHIFKKVEVQSFIIFLTAYEQFAIRAFELNSIDYVLKPFSQQDIQNSLKKLDDRVRQHSRFIAQALLPLMEKKEDYKSRFLVKKGKKIIPVETKDIAYFFKSELTFLVRVDGEQFAVDYSLEQLEDILNLKFFFRLNRQFIVQLKGIKSVERLPHNRLKVYLDPAFKEEVIVSQKKSGTFRAWMDQ